MDLGNTKLSSARLIHIHIPYPLEKYVSVGPGRPCIAGRPTRCILPSRPPVPPPRHPPLGPEMPLKIGCKRVTIQIQ